MQRPVRTRVSADASIAGPQLHKPRRGPSSNVRLARPGVSLSPAQVYRLVAEQPERLSLRTLAALCDGFYCNPNDLVEPYVEATVGKQAVNAAPAVDISADSRPVRARIIAEEKT